MLQVDDESTSVLMEHMYHHLMDGRTTVAQALRLAMLHLLRHPPSPQWRRPKYWAGFLVVGAATRLRCTAPSAHPPPQVMFRVWEYDRLLLALPASHPRSDARSFPPSLSISLSVRSCVRACVHACVRACVSKARCH